MVVENDIKYVCFEGDSDELYDLSQDPYEMKNLARLPEYDSLKERMRALLRRKMEESLDPVDPQRLFGR